MTLEEAIAEVQRLWAVSAPSPDETNFAAIVFNAVASGDLSPKAAAEQAVAVAYQRAADVVPQGWCAETTSHKEMDVVLCQAIQSAILALAPADALAEVERMKAEIAELKTYRDYGPRMDEKRQAAIMELALGADRLDRVEARQAAETEAARLNAALDEAYALGFEASGEGWNGEYAPFEVREDPDWQERRKQTLTALKGDTP